MSKNYILTTFHRAENVDIKKRRGNPKYPETLKVESNDLAGVDPSVILKHAKNLIRGKNWTNPYVDGTAAKIIINACKNRFK